jgi:acetyltransferase
MRPDPSELEGELALRDGTRVLVRPIRPDDLERERAFFHGLSERSRFQRFMHAITDLSPALLERFVNPDYERDLALVALDGDRFVAVGRYAGTADPQRAEFALVVADAWQRKGLGRALLERLADAARKAGYAFLCGTILESNHEMQELTRRLGFVPESRYGAELVVVRPLT